MDNNSVKENIIRCRKGQKLSQQDVAEKIGLSRTAYRNIEKGETKLLSDNIGKIADVLGVGAEELVLGYPSMSNPEISKEDKSYKWMYEELKSRSTFEMQKQADEISRLVNEVSTLKDYILALKNLISTKDEIIAMLKKSQDK